jgi:hypothetical protein
VGNNTNRLNTAEVTTDSVGFVPSNQAQATATFGAPTVVNGTVNVTDSVEGDLGSFSESNSTSYDRTFTCDTDEGTHPNTATIDELPASLTLLLAKADGAPRLGYTASGPVARLLATIEQRSPGGADHTTINLEAHELPDELSLLLGDRIEYRASTVMPLLRAEVTDSAGLVGLAERLLIEIVDLPAAMSFGIGETGELALTTGGGAYCWGGNFNRTMQEYGKATSFTTFLLTPSTTVRVVVP